MSKKTSPKTRPHKQSETDLILSSPKLLRGIEAGVKEMRAGKLLTRDGKEVFKKISKVEQQLFGKYKSGKKDLATNRKKYLQETLLKKHSKRPRGAASFVKNFTHAQKKTIAELKKRGLSYTEEQIFKMVS